MTPVNTPWYLDKSFLAIIAGPIFMLLGKWLKIDFNVEEIIALAATIIAFIAGNKWKSGAALIAEIKVKADAEAAKKAAEAVTVDPAKDPAGALNDVK